MDLEILTTLGIDAQGVLELTPTYGKFVLGPCERGSGGTLGSILRSALLNAVDGFAPVAFRSPNLAADRQSLAGIQGSALLVGVRLSKVIVAGEIDRDVWLELDVRGPTVATAGDLIGPPGCRVVNAELELAAVVPGARLLLAILMRRGCGLVPKMEHADLPDDVVALDATFSPVRRAAYSVERRCLAGRECDLVVLDIWTSGASGPERALAQAVAAIRRQLGVLSGGGEQTSFPAGLPIESLALPRSVEGRLAAAGIRRIGHLCTLDRRELVRALGFDELAAEEVLARLGESLLAGRHRINLSFSGFDGKNNPNLPPPTAV